MSTSIKVFRTNFQVPSQHFSKSFKVLEDFLRLRDPYFDGQNNLSRVLGFYGWKCKRTATHMGNFQFMWSHLETPDTIVLVFKLLAPYATEESEVILINTDDFSMTKYYVQNNILHILQGRASFQEFV